MNAYIFAYNSWSKAFPWGAAGAVAVTKEDAVEILIREGIKNRQNNRHPHFSSFGNTPFSGGWELVYTAATPAFTGFLFSTIKVGRNVESRSQPNRFIGITSLGIGYNGMFLIVCRDANGCYGHISDKHSWQDINHPVVTIKVPNVLDDGVAFRAVGKKITFEDEA